MNIFKKHDKNTTVKRLLTEKTYFAPKVFITFEALLKMQQYCDQCDKEIGWLGFVKHNVENDGTNSKDHTFTVYDTILCKQEVSAATADLHESGLQSVVDELIANNQFELLSEAKCWGHSHVKMAVNPSSTDEETFEELYANSDYFIRIIANKEGVLRLDIALFDLGLQFDNVDWEPIYPENISEMMEHNDALCKELELVSKQIEKTITVRVDELKEFIKDEISKKVTSYVSSYNNYSRTATQSNTGYNPAIKTIRVCEKNNKVYKYQRITDVLADDDIELIASLEIPEMKKLYGDEEEFRWYSTNDWENLEKACTAYAKYLEEKELKELLAIEEYNFQQEEMGFYR